MAQAMSNSIATLETWMLTTDFPRPAHFFAALIGLVLLVSACASGTDGDSGVLSATDGTQTNSRNLDAGRQTIEQFALPVSLDFSFTNTYTQVILQDGYFAAPLRNASGVAGRGDLLLYHPEAFNDPDALDVPGGDFDG